VHRGDIFTAAADAQHDQAERQNSQMLVTHGGLTAAPSS
jgi:hypothetical protein